VGCAAETRAAKRSLFEPRVWAMSVHHQPASAVGVAGTAVRKGKQANRCGRPPRKRCTRRAAMAKLYCYKKVVRRQSIPSAEVAGRPGARFRRAVLPQARSASNARTMCQVPAVSTVHTSRLQRPEIRGRVVVCDVVGWGWVAGSQPPCCPPECPEPAIVFIV